MFNECYKRLEIALKEKLSAMTQCADELQNLMESKNYDETKNLTSMKKQVFLTSYVELGDLAAQCMDDSEDDSDEEAARIKKEKKEKKALKRKASKHLAPKKSEGNLMGDLLKNSLGSFFKKKLIDTKDDSTKTPEEKKKESEEEELSKSERYR